MKSVLPIGFDGLRVGTRALPAYGSIETRPMIHASALNVAAVRSYSAYTADGSFHLSVTIGQSTEGTM